MKYVQINNIFWSFSTCMRIPGSIVSCMYMYSILGNLVQNGLLVVGLVQLGSPGIIDIKSVQTCSKAINLYRCCNPSSIMDTSLYEIIILGQVIC